MIELIRLSAIPLCALEPETKSKRQLGFIVVRLAGPECATIAQSVMDDPSARHLEVVGGDIQVELVIPVVHDRPECRILATVRGRRHARGVAIWVNRNAATIESGVVAMEMYIAKRKFRLGAKGEQAARHRPRVVRTRSSGVAGTLLRGVMRITSVYTPPPGVVISPEQFGLVNQV